MSINGSVSEKSYSKADLKKALIKLDSQYGLTMSWDTLQYNAPTASENTRTASFEATVTIEAYRTVISMGKNMAQVIAKKWKSII